KRFFNEVVCTQLGRPNGGFDRSVTGHHDHGLIGPVRPDLLKCLQPVHAGHPDVEKDEIGAGTFQLVQGRCPAFGSSDRIPFVLERAAEGLTNPFLIINDQYGSAHTRSCASCRRVVGSSMANVVPCPIADCTRMTPSWSFTMRLAIA